VAKEKRVRTKFNPSPSKLPRSGVNPESYMHLNPAWRFRATRMKDPFGWHTVDRAQSLEVLNLLKNLETMTWFEILIKDKGRNHTISANELSKPAQTCLEGDWQGGADEVTSLRLTNKKRVFGILDQGVFHILWWDPEHEACPSTYMDRRS
jgi:hypothetical protein